jgi:hypothetical protein
LQKKNPEFSTMKNSGFFIYFDESQIKKENQKQATLGYLIILILFVYLIPFITPYAATFLSTGFGASVKFSDVKSTMIGVATKIEE